MLTCLAVLLAKRLYWTPALIAFAVLILVVANTGVESLARSDQVDETVLAQATQQMVLALGEEYGVEPEEVQALMDSMDPAEVEGMVASQDQIARGGSNEQQPG